MSGIAQKWCVNNQPFSAVLEKLWALLGQFMASQWFRRIFTSFLLDSTYSMWYNFIWCWLSDSGSFWLNLACFQPFSMVFKTFWALLGQLHDFTVIQAYHYAISGRLIPHIQCGPIWFSDDLEWFMAHSDSF